MFFISKLLNYNTLYISLYITKDILLFYKEGGHFTYIKVKSQIELFYPIKFI